MQTIELNNYKVLELSPQEMMDIEGGLMIPWALVGRVGLRVGVGLLGIGCGVALVIGLGLLAYEIYEAS
jgi:hypothetical protein